MQNETNELIGIIYETVLDPRFWPLVLDGLIEIIDHENDDSSTTLQIKNAGLTAAKNSAQKLESKQSISTTLQNEELLDINNYQLLQRLTPHLQRVLKIRLQHQKLDRKIESISTVINNIPIGVFIVNADSQLLFSNHLADEMLRSKQGLEIIGQSIRPINAAFHQKFRSYLKAICTDSGAHKAYNLQIPCEDHGEIAILLSHFEYQDDILSKMHQAVMIFTTPPLNHRPIRHQILKDLFQFTKSESELANRLIQGQSLEDIATDRSVSIHTVRNQLNSIFSKTGTCRQSQLVSHILTSSATLQPQLLGQNNKLKNISPKHPIKSERTEYQIQLSDGRKMGYAEYGDPQGKPVVLCHSPYGCRYEKPLVDDALYEHKIRLIVPDRPGTGLSDPKVFAGYTGWISDLKQLQNHLKIQQFGIAGYCTGSLFALAAAWSLPAHINNVTIITPTAPITTLAGLKDLDPANRMCIGLAQQLPSVATYIYHTVYKGAAKNPDKFTNDVVPGDEREKQEFAREDIRLIVKSCLPELIKYGINGLPQEIRYYVKPMEFTLSDIKQPVTFWRGALDAHIGIANAMELMSSIPHAKINIVPNHGYLILYTYWEEIVKHL